MRERGVETLRGLGILLVVLAHVVGLKGAGLEVADDSPLRWLFWLTVNYRMPIFAVISGYVYSPRPVRHGALAAFFRGKARRIVMPLVGVSTLQFLVSWAAPGTHYHLRLDQMWRIYFYSYDQFWFLQSMTLVFLTIPWLELAGWLKTLRGWSVCFVLALLAEVVTPHGILPFSFDGYPYLLVSFLVGVAIQRFPGVFAAAATRGITGLLFVAGIVLQQLHDRAHPPQLFDRTSLRGLATGLNGTLFFFTIRGAGWAPLAWLGSHAFEIYLFHRFGQAGSRILLKAMGMHDVGVLFVLGVAASLGCALALEWLFRRTRFTRAWFLGESG